jgi:hypothetical protein
LSESLTCLGVRELFVKERAGLFASGKAFEEDVSVYYERHVSMVVTAAGHCFLRLVLVGSFVLRVSLLLRFFGVSNVEEKEVLARFVNVYPTFWRRKQHAQEIRYTSAGIKAGMP